MYKRQRPHLAYETKVRAALRVGKYKILTNTPWCPSVAPSEGALSGMDCDDGGAAWLFDVEADAAEEHDLREAMPGVFAALEAELAAYYQQELGDSRCRLLELKDAKAAFAAADGELAPWHAAPNDTSVLPKPRLSEISWS